MANQVWEIIKEIALRNRERHAVPSLDGALYPNDMLDKFEVLCDSISKPDDIAIDPTGTLYVSSGNRVLRMSRGGDGYQKAIAEFDGQTCGLNFHPNGSLMVCVSGKGLAFANETGAHICVEKVEGQVLRCPTSAVADAGGKIYITEGTSYHEPQDWVWDLMEKRAAGRLILYEPGKERSKVLLSGLSYPHGVCITHDGQSLLLTESWKHTVSRFPLNDIRPGTRENIILPGYPARIVPSSDGGYWICLFCMRTHLVEFVLTDDKYRKEMMATVDPDHWISPALSSGKSMLEPLQGAGIKVLGITKPWAPPRSYGLVIKLDHEYDIVRSFHSRIDGRRHGITGLREANGVLYLVSKGNSLILKATRELMQ